MKKLAFLLCVCLSQFCFAHRSTPLALQSTDNNFIGGILFGGNISALTNDYYERYSKVGLNTGLTVLTRVDSKNWLGFEIIYSRKGCIGVRSRESPYVGTFFEKYYLKLNYVEVPIYIHMPMKSWCHGSIGATYGMLLNEKEILKTDRPLFINPDLYYSRKHAVDVLIGGGLYLSPSVYLNIRYQRSIIPVRDANRVFPEVGQGRQYSNCIAVQFLYLKR